MYILLNVSQCYNELLYTNDWSCPMGHLKILKGNLKLEMEHWCQKGWGKTGVESRSIPCLVGRKSVGSHFVFCNFCSWQMYDRCGGTRHKMEQDEEFTCLHCISQEKKQSRWVFKYRTKFTLFTTWCHLLLTHLVRHVLLVTILSHFPWPKKSYWQKLNLY